MFFYLLKFKYLDAIPYINEKKTIFATLNKRILIKKVK